MEGKFGRFPSRAPAEFSGNDANNEGAEKSGEAIHYSSVADLKKNLVPWMRHAHLPKASAYAYHGLTDKEVGHFIVQDENGRTTLVDREGNQISLFGAVRPTVGRARPSRHVRIEQWLAQKGISARDATFDVFTYETGDEEQTQVEAEREEDLARGEPSLIEEPAATVDQDMPETEAEKAPKIKAPRKPRRKKPIKAERKARLAEAASEGFQRHVDILIKTVHGIKSSSKESEDKMLAAMESLVTYLNAHPHFKSEFAKRLDDPEMIEIRAFLSLYREERNFTANYSGRSAVMYLRKLSNRIYTDAAHTDPFRSPLAMHWSYNSVREFGEYASSLFPDMDGSSLMAYFHTRGPERWLDIGSGETYRIPTSMMNVIPSINQKIRIVGLDPLYEESLASLTDKAMGRHKLDPVWKNKNELVGGTAQSMEFPDASFDTILSLYALDKVNDEVEGTVQSLRQIARVLKPDGKARLLGMHLIGLAPNSPLYTYFEVQDVDIWQEQFGDPPRELATVILIRRTASAEDEARLRADIDGWLQKYTATVQNGK